MARASYLESARAMALGTLTLADFCAAMWPALSPPLTLELEGQSMRKTITKIDDEATQD
jgi:hypothetical protein